MSRDCGFIVSLSTNGSIVDEEIASRIKELDIKISVSIDGKRSTHDKLRVRGSYDKAVRAIDTLKAVGVNPAIRSTLFAGEFSNLHDMIWLAKFALQKNLILKIRRVRPAGRAISNKLIFMKSTLDFWKIVKQLNTFSWVDLEDIFNFNNERKNIFNAWFDCGAGTRSVYVNMEGNVSPCIFLGKNFYSGNIESESFINIWRLGKGFKKIRMIVVEGNPLCKKCSRNQICKGECRAIAHFATNDWQANDPCCPVLSGILPSKIDEN